MDIKNVLLANYLPYAKGTIIGRAIPSIDGLKPAHRRILYTMYKMGLLNGNKTKSSNIVGQTMRLHPHGDSAIYETMVRMAAGNESLNTPYIDSKGNFGKVYSTELAFAAARYTEAKLMPICKEMFTGIDEDAIDFVENFDSTMDEPTLIPVAFPSILVNPSNGIAVGMSSSIPSFSLKNVCESTIGIIKGDINNAEQLMGVLGVPEFTTGGYIHADDASLVKLGETGKGSFVISGSVTTYPDKIVITEIPYRTTAESIINDITAYAKSGELKEVSKVNDGIDLKGFKITVELKARSNPKEVLRKMCRLTNLRMTISFNTRVIIGDECVEIGLYELLQKWIEFRMTTLHRMYTFKKARSMEKEHILSAWEKIASDIKGVATLIPSKNEKDVKAELMSAYGLEEAQAEYILDVKTRLLTKDNLSKKLEELKKERDAIKEYTAVLASDKEKKRIMVEELTRINQTYGQENKTHRADMLIEEPTGKVEEVIDDSSVVVVLTKSGYLKRLVTLRDLTTFELPNGEEEEARWNVRNNQYLIVFTYDGTAHKILVNSIDASKGSLKDEVYQMVGLSNRNEIMFVDTAGDFSKSFNVVYPNGRGVRVYYKWAAGARKKYKSLFDGAEPGSIWYTFSNRFFMITQRRKAAFCDLELSVSVGTRVAFKVARVGDGDKIVGLQPLENVPNPEEINLDKYNKPYTVLINEDVLWKSSKKA